MYHFIVVAIVLMTQYLIIYYTFGLYYRLFKRYEIDLEQQTSLVFKVDTASEKEYAMLINELDDD